MPKIYFSKTIEPLLKNFNYSKLGANIAIKVHFGEQGCVTYMNPKIVKAVYDAVKSKKKESSIKLVECNVLYKGSRCLKDDHIATAKSHGFDFADIDILDGNMGEESIDIKVDESYTAKLGKGIKKYDSMIVISHFKGHMMAGFGGAIKNCAMGLVSRAGKLNMHSNIKPSINFKCIGCEICKNNCNYNAIQIIDHKAKIDPKKCVGCAICIAVCPHYAVNIPWGGGTSKSLQEHLVKHARAIFSIIPNDKIIYINILEKITKDCDCMHYVQKPMMDDVGILMSDDILAIDTASYNMCNEMSKNQFDKINDVDKKNQIEAAENEGIGSSDYEIEIV